MAEENGKVLVPDLRAEWAKNPEEYEKMEQQARENCRNYPCSECDVKSSCYFERIIAVAKGIE